MRPAAFGFIACSLLFLFGFASSTFRDDLIERTGKLVYGDVLRNSINRFLQRRKTVLKHSGISESWETVPLDRFGLHWSGNQSYFTVDVQNHSIIVDRGLKVTAFRLRGSWSDPVISLHLDLHIPTLTVEDGTWSFRGKWHNSPLNISDAYMFSYNDVRVSIRLDMELRKIERNYIWKLDRVKLENFDLIPLNPHNHAHSTTIFPADIPMRHIIVEMRPSIASLLEKQIFDFLEKHFSKCSWHRIMLGRF